MIRMKAWGSMLWFCGAALGYAADVKIVSDGKPTAAVWVTTNDYAALKPCVDDFLACVEKMSGARLPLLVTNNPAGGAAVLPIFAGALAVKQCGPPAKSSPYKQGWRLVVSPKGIGFIGESAEAVGYAVYELLDRLGCRWFMPSEMGEVIPSLKTVSLPETDVSGLPSTLGRKIWYAEPNFIRRNRMGGVYVQHGHALEISGYVSEQQLKDHPDWNAEIGGKRGVNGRFCWANSDLAAAVADGINAYIEKNKASSVSLSPNDGIAFCECAKCKALDAGDMDKSMGCVSITDRYAHFLNQVAEKVAAKHPTVLMGFLAYVQYTRPPVREKLHPNLVPVIAPITYCRAHSMCNTNCPSRQDLRAIMEGWSKAAQKIALYEYAYNLAEVSAPNPMLTKWGEDLRFLYDRGLTFWFPETLPNFESVLPGLYLGMRMSFNSEQKPAEVFEDFVRRFYGPAADPMRVYWLTFDKAWTDVPEHAGSGFGYWRRFAPEVLAKARAAVSQALKACPAGSVEQKRVQMADDSLAQFERFMKLRADLVAGRLAALDADSDAWYKTQLALGAKYAPQVAFNQVGWTPHTVAGQYFTDYFRAPYSEGGALAKTHAAEPPIRRWKWAIDKDGIGEAQGWHRPDADDKAWKETDVGVDTWAALGLWEGNGPVWYRAKVSGPAVPAGKKVLLWVSSFDGAVQAFVNGQKAGEASGYCKPYSFDVTAVLKPAAENTIALKCTRQGLNELGAGGLLGPAVVFVEK